jgi:hypothetical protein
MSMQLGLLASSLGNSPRVSAASSAYQREAVEQVLVVEEVDLRDVDG